MIVLVILGSGPTISTPITPTASYIQNSITVNPCSPAIIGIWPSSITQSFKNYVTASWPAPGLITTIIDGVYPGMLWQGWPIQTMNDPYALYYPPCPCRETYETVTDCFDTLVGYSCWSGYYLWTEDQLCLGPQTLQYDDECNITVYGQDYFAKHPIFEAILNVPVGAPPLIPPANFTSSYVVPGVGNLTYLPWFEWLEQITEVCNDCTRFDAYLISDGVYCDNTVIQEVDAP